MLVLIPATGEISKMLLNANQKATIIILASGSGSRAGGSIPKQYQLVAGQPILHYSLQTAFEHQEVQSILLVVNECDQHLWQPIIDRYKNKTKFRIVFGGSERCYSVFNALKELELLNLPAEVIILVHDSARPFISSELISRAIRTAILHDAAIPVLPVTDTIKQVDESKKVTATLSRKDLRLVQTPQAFKFYKLQQAYKAAAKIGIWNFTDDASIVEANNTTVYCFEGEQSAFKITNKEDFLRSEIYAGGQAVLDKIKTSTRVATGYDVHAFGEGDHIWLGGIKIKFGKSLIGHSDADPVLHALTDAVLGTIGEGDIGSHFPPSDPQWKGAESHVFLKHAVNMLPLRDGKLIHLDTTIICESPKIGPYREIMRHKIAEICQIDIGRVSVKATTSEKLGFTGRGEGIAAMATATVELPD